MPHICSCVMSYLGVSISLWIRVFHLFSVSLHSLKSTGCCGQTHVMLNQNSKNNMDYTVLNYVVPGFFLWNSSFKPDCFGIPRALCGVSGSSDVIWSVFCVVWEPEEHFALAALIGNPFQSFTRQLIQSCKVSPGCPYKLDRLP